MNLLNLFLVLFSCAIAYFVGSIPTGFWFAKYIFNIDITKVGSGNIGASNVARVLGKKYFILIFAIDFAKAFLTLCLIKVLFGFNTATDCNLILCAIALLVGNAYSIFLNFTGGKGVATTTGIMAFLFPFKLLLIFASIWLLSLIVSQRPYMASLAAAYLSCVGYYFFFLHQGLYLFFFLIFVCFWLTFRHRGNILG